MNYKLLGILAVGLAMGCGDDTSGGGGSGGGSGGGEAGSTGNIGGSPEGGAPAGGAPAGGAPEGGGTGETCEDQYPAGAATAATLVIQSCGCTAGAPCEADCADDPVCETPGPTAEDPCGACVQEQAGMQSQCALDAALSKECSGECAQYIQCVIAGG